MKLTPLDIHHKEFRLALRGYNQEEVDQFLDEVADEFERLFKENIDQAEKLDAANERVRGYAEIEKTLHNTMLAAQQSAEGIQAKAAQDAEVLLRDAEMKAKELVQAALAEKQKTQSEFMRIKTAEDDFRLKFRTVLEEYMRRLHAVPVDADIAALVGMAEEKVLDMRVAVERGVQAPAESAPAPAAAPVAQIQETPASPPAPAPDESSLTRPRAQATRHSEGTQPLTTDVPQTGFVQSLTLGEVEGPDVRPDSPTFDEPSEFSMPARGAVGERDDDLDIEEID
jgi:cell division initiation protein